jgi:hypothetical protein
VNNLSVVLSSLSAVPVLLDLLKLTAEALSRCHNITSSPIKLSFLSNKALPPSTTA